MTVACTFSVPFKLYRVDIHRSGPPFQLERPATDYYQCLAGSSTTSKSSTTTSKSSATVTSSTASSTATAPAGSTKFWFSLYVRQPSEIIDTDFNFHSGDSYTQTGERHDTTWLVYSSLMRFLGFDITGTKPTVNNTCQCLGHQITPRAPPN